MTPGKLIRKTRLVKIMGLREAAKEIGIDPIRLNYIEQDGVEMTLQEVIFLSTFCGIESTEMQRMQSYSKEEIEKNREEKRKSMAEFGEAYKRISEAPGVDKNLSVECPRCSGRLHFVRSGYNGHVRAQCETDGCMSWIQ